MTLSPSARLRPVQPDALPAALAAALAGGPPVAPLPADPVERRLGLAALRLEEPLEHDDVAAVICTSGSTGRPKGVVLSRAAVAASVRATEERLGGPGSWVLALPGHYVAGLMVVARTVLAGTGLAVVPADLSGLADAAGRLAGRRYLSLVPTQLRRACDRPAAAEAMAGFDAVLLGGGAADPALLDRARRLGIPVVPTYGMSETCGGCVYDGVPLDGVEVGVEAGTGQILLGGPVLFSGYRLRPDLTAETLTRGRLRTQDRGRLAGGRLEVTGRVDDIVVSGGVNVDLAAVERAAARWPGLGSAEIAVVGVPDPEWGTAVVAVTDGSARESDLREHLRTVLPPAATPRRLVRLAALPRTSAGKLDRQRLVAELAPRELAPREQPAREQPASPDRAGR